MPAPRPGDLFAVTLPDGRYATGRVTFDVRAQGLRPGHITDDSPLAFFSGALLVDLYGVVLEAPAAQRGDRIVPGVFVTSAAFRSGALPIVGHEAVDPEEVEFPETFAQVQGRLCFQRGEVVLPLDEHREAFESVQVYPTILRAEALPEVAAHYLEAAGLLEGGGADHDLGYADLRFTDRREAVYEALGERPDASYAAFARRHGHDVARFF